MHLKRKLGVVLLAPLAGVVLFAAIATAADTPGSFSPTGSMGVKRQVPAAAPLLDGRVLVAGGIDAVNNLQSGEIFNPATATFT
ncbi:MAG: kelch repeat-containing protein, partial [Solirubrobacterales bacterium]